MPDKFIEEIDATPNKKVLMSISKDIDLYHGICEMIDNSIDNWKINGMIEELRINLFFDEGDNKIEYEDNSGGIREDILSMIIQPGGTERTLDEETIGIFGVGSKRALIALAGYSETISRYGSDDTFKIIIDEDWLSNESWKVKKFKTDDIEHGKTRFLLKQLKFRIDDKVINDIKQKIAETYFYYIKEHGVKIKVNGVTLAPIIFDRWAYPPGREPRRYIFNIPCENEEYIKVELLVGLMLESSQTGEYGFDVYCNDRMILKNVNDYRLGFKSSMLGQPHPTVAWFKGIIRLNGKNRFMPWNSSKSNIDSLNPTYQKLLDLILKYAKPYVQLSRRLSSSSDEDIKPYSAGSIVTIDLRSREPVDSDFPQLPPGKESYFNKALKENKEIIKTSPWSRGILENILAVDAILKTKLENKNRYALILLDSCLEIAFKDYLVWIKKININKVQERYRERLHKTIKNQKIIPNEYWNRIDYYYDLRCKLYHEDATPTITDSDILNLRSLVCDILEKMMGLTFDFTKHASFIKKMKVESDLQREIDDE
ncbi:MAG TPA: ATP-binding protein [Thermoplasmatales archaeon]|nr:ATP-binding protein [Thermoplasmatales archaeon]